jgi:Putative Flp pilus-assembly TadE/G-like
MILSKHLHRLRKDQRGTVSIIMGLLIVPLVGALGIGFEVSNWYMTGRGMQNAADAAALAAATNGGANYDVEAKAVAAQYGFVDGANTITVAASNTAPCPAGGNTCYGVTISGAVPLLVSQVVGYLGDTTLNGAAAKQLSSVAIAKPTIKPEDLCMLALAGSGAAQAIRTNGSPVSNMNGCNIMSNTAAQCNGSNLGANYGFAVGTSNGCGLNPRSNQTAVLDPYAGKYTVPPLSDSGCNGNYPQETKHGNSYSVAASNQLSGTLNLKGSTYLNNGYFKCGDQMLTADTVIDTGGKPAVLVIENGQLDLNGHALTTADGSAVTLVFSGDNSGSYTHAPTDNTNGTGGRLDINAPTSGAWSGVAIYQDPSLTSGLDVAAAGNSPTWNITGLIYMPHASVNLNGAVDKATHGNACVVMIADNFTISGTGGILKTNTKHCGDAGLTMPSTIVPGRSALVQ